MGSIMTKEASPETRVVGYVYNLVTTLGDGQQLTISGNLALDAEKTDMDAEFDKLLSVVNRLATKHKVEKKKGDIAADETMVAAMIDDLHQLDETHKGKPKLSTVEAQNRTTMERNIRHLKSRIGRYKEELAQLEKEAA